MSKLKIFEWVVIGGLVGIIVVLWYDMAIAAFYAR